VLGLSGENMTRLMAGEPILVDLPDAAGGCPMPAVRIVILGGRTEAAIAADLAGSELASLVQTIQPGQTIRAVSR